MHAVSRNRLAIVGAFAVAGFGAPAVHGQTSTTVLPVVVFCTSIGQLCSPAFTTPVTTLGLLQVSVTMGAAGCSNVLAHFLVDGTELAASTFLAPGQTSATFTLSPVSAGAHTLAIQGEGQVGGCNSGNLGSWGGSAQVTVNALAPPIAAAIPAPGLVATTLAFLLGAGVFLRRRRNRG